MARMIIELGKKRSFIFTSSKQAAPLKWRSHTSVLASLFLNIYCTSTSALPDFQKFFLRRRSGIVALLQKIQGLEETLSQDMTTLLVYLQTWKLKLSHTKTVTPAFHLNNREAQGELNIYNTIRFLLFCPNLPILW